MDAHPFSHALDPQKKIALVTGGSRGIGKAIAQALAAQDFQVLITYRKKEEEALACVADIEQAGGVAACHILDIENTDAIRDLFSHLKTLNLACLVNNAGITKDGLLVRMSENDFTHVIDVCLRGTFVATQEAAKIMIKRRAGRIISIASVVGLMGNAGQANYAAAKAGILGFTKATAKEVAARGITVNAVAPGFIATDMTAVLPEKVVENLKAGIPMGRLGEPEDIAKAVAFLVSDEAAYITGQTLHVNGGMFLN